MSDMGNVDRFHRAARQVGVTAPTGCGLEGLLLGNPPGVRSKPSAYGGPADAVQGGGGGDVVRTRGSRRAPSSARPYRRT